MEAVSVAPLTTGKARIVTRQNPLCQGKSVLVTQPSLEPA
jgi:hypothetical protein